MTRVDLGVEARAEVERLSWARALVRDGDTSILRQLEADTAWLALARSTHLRRAVRGADLHLWRITLVNGGERAVESTVVALRIARGTSASSTDLTERVQQASALWRDDSTRMLARFSAARLERERAIARTRPSLVGAIQPGLFDRRADRVRAGQLAERAASSERDESRLSALERMLTASVRPPQLLLALVTTR